MGGATLLTGIILSISADAPQPKIEKVAAQQFDSWLRDYGKKQNQKYVKHSEKNSTYLIVPRKMVSAYEQEERRIAEAEQKRLIDEKNAAERQRKRDEEAAEQKAYTEAMTKYENTYWIHYLKTYPNSPRIQEVRTNAEEKALRDAVLGKRGGWEVYMTYFKDGKNADAVKSFGKFAKKWDEIMEGLNTFDDFNSGKSSLPYQLAMEKLTAINEFDKEMQDWMKNQSNSFAKPVFMQGWTTITQEQSVLESIIESGKKRIEAAKKFTKGDNVCLLLKSVSIDEKGEKIKGSEGETLIRLTIEDTNEDKSKFRVNVREIYNMTKKRKTDSFTFSSPRRVWEENKTDWIDVADWDLDYCK